MTLVCLTWITVQLLVYVVFTDYYWGSVHADPVQVSSAHPSHNPSVNSLKKIKPSNYCNLLTISYSSYNYYSVIYINFQTNIFSLSIN